MTLSLLPCEILNIIYEYDSTYHEIYFNIIQMLKYHYSYYENGNIKHLYQLNENNQITFIQSYSLSGILLSIDRFKNGVKHGLCQNFHYSTGKLMNEKIFKNGNLNGLCKGYFDNDKLYFISFYVNGMREGEYISYNKNGDIRTHCYYHKNKIIKYIIKENRTFYL
jgi:antitoxin component YwqK of YwqJK toxin-antitoxin module